MQTGVYLDVPKNQSAKGAYVAQSPVISDAAVKRRVNWTREIVRISGSFGADTARMIEELNAEIKRDGIEGLLDHLRLCGSIPETYGHDSSEEKLYSKYTDALLSCSFAFIGLTSEVLVERADAADVEAFGPDYSLVADAKAFRLTRTAKNQKDFKIDALDGWRKDRTHSMVVSPIYHLPTKSSQIYQQAIRKRVCIFSYSHLSIVVRHGNEVSQKSAQHLLRAILKCAESLPARKDARAYWTCVNSTMLKFHPGIAKLWKVESAAMVEALEIDKAESLLFLAKEQKKIPTLSREEAINRLLKDGKFDTRKKKIKSIKDKGLLAIS